MGTTTSIYERCVTHALIVAHIYLIAQGANVHTVHYDGFDSWQLAARVGQQGPPLGVSSHAGGDHR